VAAAMIQAGTRTGGQTEGRPRRREGRTWILSPMRRLLNTTE